MKAPKQHSTTSSNRQQQLSKTHFFDPESEQGFFSNDPKVQTKSFFGGTDNSNQNTRPAFLQTKLNGAGLKIGLPNDRYEREADRMADKVINGRNKPAVEKQNGAHTTTAGPSGIQTKCAECEQKEELQKKEAGIQRKPIFESEADVQPKLQSTPVKVQTKCAACAAKESEQAPVSLGAKDIHAKFEFPEVPKIENEPQEETKKVPEPGEKAQEEKAPAEGKDKKKPAKGGAKFDPPAPEPPEPEPERPPEIQKSSQTNTPGGAVSAQFHSSLNASKGGGTPLSGDTRSEMESHFGSDFSGVRVHTDGQAVQMNQDIGAKAFTHGNDIYFNRGQYDTGSSSGKHLLAHELTHTVQQGAAGKKVQRYPATANPVQVEGKVEKPNDGQRVEGRMDNKIKNDPDFDDDAPRSKAAMSDEDRKKAKPDRSKVGKEKNKVEAGGAHKPDVDRGGAAQTKTSDQQKQLTEKVDEKKDAGKTDKEQKKDKKGGKMAVADTAAAKAVQLQQKAASIVVPAKPKAFKHPNIQPPEDSKGEALPRDPDTDMKVRGLGLIGEGFREEGYEMKKKSVQFRRVSLSLEAVQQKQREDQAIAEEGTTKMDAHTQERQKIAEDSKKALEESKKRQSFTEKEAPKIADKAAEGSKDSSALKSEAGAKAEKAENEKPDDPDARADAEKQSGEMKASSEGAANMDDAIKQTGERAKKYSAEAEIAKKKNEATDAEIKEGDKMIAKTAGRVQEMHGKNAASGKRIKETAAYPDNIRKDAVKTAATADQLIQQSHAMEDELNALQDDYLAKSKALKGKKEAEEELKNKNQNKAPEISPQRAKLFELAALEGDAFQAAVDNLTEADKQELSQELIKMGQEEAAAKKAAGDKGPPPDPRAEQIAAIDNDRKTRASGVQQVADANFNYLDAEKRGQIAAELSAKSMIDDVKGIKILDMAKGMVEGMINPVMAVKGAVDGFKKIGKGIGAIFDASAWAKDPLGNLLKIASSITTGLATVFSTILGIAGLIMALMVAITIASWGFALPVTGPVMSWMGTVMTYAGWGAIISGGLAVYFNYLSYIKNIHDAQSAQTSEALFGEAKEMKENIKDGMTGAMAIVEGVGAVKMGPVLANKKFLTPNASKLYKEAGGKFTRQVGKEYAKEMVVGTAKKIAGLPGAMVVGARKLLGSGKKGLTDFGRKLKAAFSRKKKVDVDSPAAIKQQKQTLELTKNKETPQLTKSEVNTEFDAAARQKVKDSPDPKKDAEIDLDNGHTLKRDKETRKWCRSSDQCEIVSPDAPKKKKLDDKADAKNNSKNKTDKDQVVDIGPPGSESHKAQRWVDYQKKHPDRFPEITTEIDPKWSKQYDTIIENGKVGRGFEKEALDNFGLNKNNEVFMNPDGSGGFIPDSVSGNPSKVEWGKPYDFTEVKGWQNMSNTGNLKAMIDYVEEFGGSIQAVFRSSKHAKGVTHISKPLMDRLVNLQGQGMAKILRYP